jgi:hypothetical protein
MTDAEGHESERTSRGSMKEKVRSSTFLSHCAMHHAISLCPHNPSNVLDFAPSARLVMRKEEHKAKLGTKGRRHGNDMQENASQPTHVMTLGSR